MQQRRIETARRVIFGRRGEFIFEAEAIQKRAQHRIIMRGKTVELAERIWNTRQRLAEMFAQHVAIGHIVGHFAQAIHIVRESQQTRLDLVFRQNAKSMAHHGRARDFAEGSDMGQARGSIAGFKQHILLAGALDALHKFARLLEGPGGCLGRGIEEFGGHGTTYSVLRKMGARQGPATGAAQ